jgi:hypothetical protein
VYHLELRQFPHNMCRFNLTEQELLATVVMPWVREQWIDLGERKWSPHQAKLTVLAGPELALDQLKMGRGWRNAQRQSEDVTERVLAAAKQAADIAPVAPPTEIGDVTPGAVAGGPAIGSSSPRGASDAGLLPLLGPDPAALLQAWRLVVERRPELSPSESLELAEETLTSLERNQS